MSRQTEPGAKLRWRFFSTRREVEKAEKWLTAIGGQP